MAEVPKQSNGSFLRILSYATTMDRCFMLVATVCSAGAGAALPIMNIVFGKLAGIFNGYFVPGSGITEDQFRSAVNKNALYILYLFIAKFVLSYISTFAFRMVGIRISAAIRLTYLAALFNLPISAIDRLPAGSATDTLTNVANSLQLAVSDKLGMLVQGLSLIISAYIIAFIYSWRLTLVSSSVILFVIAVYSLSTPVYLRYNTKVLEYNASASGVTGEILRGLRTVKSLCAEDEAVSRHSKFTALAQATGQKMSFWIAMQLWPIFFVTYGNMALTFWAGVRFYAQGLNSGVADLVIVLFSVLIVLAGIGSAFTPLQYIGRASSASVSCFNIIDAPQLQGGGLQAPEVSSKDDITFNDVRFTYPSRPQAEVLKGLSFVVPNGKVTAIVGPSGGGKSTIVALVQRWYDLSEANSVLPAQPEADAATTSNLDAKQRKKDGASSSPKGKPETEAEEATEHVYQNAGKIMVGSHNVETVNRKWWRSQIGLVQQEPVLFNETIFQTVANGLIGSEWEHASAEEKLALVQEACHESLADEFIRRLPKGYHTLVGEGGIQLSGGQRQRLAIARSIIKKPSILILDEATSSIDVQGEKLVAAALERASKGRTTIVIAHRLSTIRRANHIVVLRDGTAIEEGTHDELVSLDSGVYAGLVRAQHLELGNDSVKEADLRDQEQVQPYVENIPIAEDSDAPGDKAAKTKAKGFFSSVVPLLYEHRKLWLFFAAILIGCMGAGSATALQAWLFSHILTVFTNADLRAIVNAANFWALMLFILATAAGVCYGVVGYSSNALSFRVSTAHRTSYFDSVIRKPIHWFDVEGRAVGTLTSQLSSDPHQLQELLGHNVTFPVIAVFSLTGCIIVSFYFGWKLTIVIFFSALPVILMGAFFRVRYEVNFEAMNAKVFAESSQFAAETITAFRTVASLTMEDSILARFEKLLDDHVRAAFLKGRLSTVVLALSESVELCSMALAFWYGGQLMASREYNPLQFFVIYASIIQGAQAAGQFLAIAPNVANATAATNRIVAYRDGSERVSDDRIAMSDKDDGLKIEFQSVDFQYPTRDMPVYRNMSFTIEPGQYIGIVGASGCGKTTIISLLERFYDVSSGAILIDNVELSTLPLKQYRSLCALVTQEPTIFGGTIRENLVLGLARGATQDEIEAASRAAEIHDFIVSLPQGFDTRLTAGTHSSLSGGQKQRLCIARALLRRPRLLMLDEATNSLDSVSEGLVQKAIERVAAAERMTILAVAHRLATVRNADRILVLGEGGVLIEDGSHADLVARKGAYWEMCKAQALDQ